MIGHIEKSDNYNDSIFLGLLYLIFQAHSKKGVNFTWAYWEFETSSAIGMLCDLIDHFRNVILTYS